MKRLLAGSALLLLAACAAREPQWRAEPALVWCYRTLAEPECHAEPRPEDARRLIAAAPQRRFFPLAADPPAEEEEVPERPAAERP
jgi:hypothetical protein